MPLYEYQCDACGHRFEMIQKFSDPPLDDVPEVRRRRAQAACRRRRFSSRAPAGTSPTTRRRIRAAQPGEAKASERRTPSDETSDKTRQGRQVGQGREEPRRPRRPRRSRQARPAPAERARRPRPTPRRTRPAPPRRPASAVGRLQVQATRGRPRTCPARSGRRSAKYTTAFRNPSLLPVSWRTPFTSQA